LLWQWVLSAASFDLLNTGRSKAARMAMMRMTTNNSINVKPVASQRADRLLRRFIIKRNTVQPIYKPAGSRCIGLNHRQKLCAIRVKASSAKFGRSADPGAGQKSSPSWQGRAAALPWILGRRSSAALPKK
jgi:hypothetical protein